MLLLATTTSTATTTATTTTATTTATTHPHPSPPSGGLLVPGASIRVLLPTGEELFLGDTKASGRDACVLRVTNADMFEKV